MRIAIIGAGISGIAFAGVMMRFGHDCTVFDKAEKIGGIWALAYPEVRLQNSREQYTFIDFPWPEQPDQHPTATQILNYLAAAVAHYGIDVRLSHAVTVMTEAPNGWTLNVTSNDEQLVFDFDYAVVSIGQYAEQKYRPEFSGETRFEGAVITEREVQSLEMFRDKNVAVIGFGKSAVDIASFAAPLASSVAHVFRTPRWLVPFRLLGVHYTYPFFARATTAFMPSWVHPGRIQHTLHRYLPALVSQFWRMIEFVVRKHIGRHAHVGSAGATERLNEVTPKHDFASDMRSATAMAPLNYYPMVADRRIQPHHAAIQGFSANGIELDNGEHLDADIVVLSVGSGTPVFPFLPERYRAMVEAESDGVQLYRHLLHPSIPRLAFAGYNHGFMHVPAAEIGALWICAMLRGDIELPEVDVQERTIEVVREWKRAHIQYEPSRACAVSTRFQQYIDLLLLELKVSPLRKMPNVFAECFARYGGADYVGVVAKVLENPPSRPRAATDLDS